MATDEVTMGEVVRRLDTITGQLAQITTSLAADKRHYEATFVSKELLDSRLNGVDQRITETEKDITTANEALRQQQARGRQTVIALLSIGVPAVISIILTIITLVGSGVGA